MFGQRASAIVRDGRLVLSMPDAETPVVWMLDMNDAATSVLRLESDKQGFYVIKKHSGKTTDTVAVYRNRRPAVRALNIATKALDRASNWRGGRSGGFSRTASILVVILFIWFALSRLGSLDHSLLSMALSPFFTEDSVESTQAQVAQEPMSESEYIRKLNSVEAMGIPLPADDALKAQSEKESMGW